MLSISYLLTLKTATCLFFTAYNKEMVHLNAFSSNNSFIPYINANK